MNKPTSPNEFTLHVRVTLDNPQETAKLLHAVREGFEKVLQGQKEIRTIMATVKERLGALNADVDNLEGADKAAFQRLNDLIAAGNTLSPEDQAAFDALEARLIADATNANAVGQPPANP